MLCYDRIDISKALILLSQVHLNNISFLTIGIF